jgi:hypothetical protein
VAVILTILTVSSFVILEMFAFGFMINFIDDSVLKFMSAMLAACFILISLILLPIPVTKIFHYEKIEEKNPGQPG